MKGKIWYYVILVHDNGEKEILAKVKSKGLAHIVAREFRNIYKNDRIIIE